MKLEDITLRNIRPAPKPQELSDGCGLQLLVQPNGSKLWPLALPIWRQQKTLALGA
ncbi:Arm DNA-binding domain-containing protein [Bradyrhizobium shewense]|uniref:Arm DNA-binding domain-containing protein n=1 Tax=Bradyrhizobium shewense TaxID=1761772 RepID=UPI003D320993